MLIMRFHKLIQSKLVWILFVSIIVISFVALQVASDSSPDPMAARLEQPVAMIDGEDVSFIQLEVTRRLMALQTRQRIDPDLMTEVALNHLATVKYARKIGIDVDTEFAARQFALNFTNGDGELDEMALNQFRQNIRGSQISEADYIEFVRQQLTVDQLRRVLSGSVLVPEFDAERWASLQTDEFIVAYAPMGPELLSEEVEATDEEIEAYFAENATTFTLPEQRTVRYMTVSSDSQSEAIATPTVEDARDAYFASPESYTREVTTEGEDGEEVTQTEPIPFDDVQDQILAEITTQREIEAARSFAMSLAIQMTPRRGRSAEDIETVSKNAGLELFTTQPFSINSALEGLPNARAFKQESFQLEFSEFGQRAGPIQIDNEFVIIELVDIQPPRVPDIEEVKERVAIRATNAKQREALAAHVDEIADKIRTSIAEGKTFTDAAKSEDLNVLTSDPISLMTLDPRRSMIPGEIVRELPAHQVGDLIGPVQTQFGGFFIASVQERTPQPIAKEESLPQLRQMLASQVHFQGTFARFQEQVIAPMIEEL